MAGDGMGGAGMGGMAVATCVEECAGMPRDLEPSLGTDRETPEAQAWATCFSCRCKSALGALPSQEDIRCETAQGPLTRWRPRRNPEGRVVGIEPIDPEGTDTSECLNPGMAAAGCDLQARFKRMLFNDGNTEFQMVCRKRDVTSNGYYEYLLIGHNQDNGATCFWQAQDSTFNGRDTPKLDLAGATAAEKKLYTNTLYLYSEGPSTCTSCHAADAFLLSPYLKSAWSVEDARNDRKAISRITRDKAYNLVTADQPNPQPVIPPGEDLAAPGQPLAVECGSCHRVRKGTHCNFAVNAVAEDHGLPNMTPVDLEALLDHASPLVHWMPPTGAGTLSETLALQTLVENACRQ
jgi:hypothetical protein